MSDKNLSDLSLAEAGFDPSSIDWLAAPPFYCKTVGDLLKLEASDFSDGTSPGFLLRDVNRDLHRLGLPEIFPTQPRIGNWVLFLHPTLRSSQ